MASTVAAETNENATFEWSTRSDGRATALLSFRDKFTSFQQIVPVIVRLCVFSERENRYRVRRKFGPRARVLEIDFGVER